jgi:hypothetical protein
MDSLPDGETGERRNWIISMLEAFRDHPVLEVAKDGDWSDYDKTPRFRIKAGERLQLRAPSLGGIRLCRPRRRPRHHALATTRARGPR